MVMFTDVGTDVASSIMDRWGVLGLVLLVLLVRYIVPFCLVEDGMHPKPLWPLELASLTV